MHGEIQSNEHPINLDHAVGELLCNVPLPLQRIGEERAADGCREKLTVVTKGERGCTAYTDGETFDVPGFPVDAVSTLGTRDSFRALDGRSTIPSWDELEASVA